MIGIIDNGIGISPDIWETTLRIFQTPENPNSLYEKAISGENEYYRELFLSMPSSIGMGIPIIQKICRLAGISVAVESVRAEVAENKILNEGGTRFYLVFS